MAKNNLRILLTSIVAVFALAFSLATGIEIPRAAHAQEATPAPTPAPIQAINKADLHQALVDLGNTWTVMCVAAHPDDEDGTTLTVLRRRDGVHTVSLFSTYGEGGQNAVGPELYEELGVIRAQETMKAARIQGSEPYFLGLQDFGFSKSADEAFKAWGHDEALKRMVFKIRELRPDVIITNHDTTSGHGHHQATGRLIIEAFDAAADPQRFPEQLAKVKPWQAQRLFVRVFGGANAQVAASDKIIAVDPNEADSVRGTSFAEQALAALQQHATQGPWPKSMAEMMRARRIEGGKLPMIRYRLLREAAGASPLTPNANTPLAGLELPEAFANVVAPPKIDGKPLTDFLDRPDRVLAALVDWRAGARRSFSHTIDGVSGPQTAFEQAIGDPRYNLFEARANHALAVASGVSLTLTSSTPVLVPGVPTTFSINISNPGMEAIHVDDLRLNGWKESGGLNTAEVLLPDTETVVTVDSTTPEHAPLSVPHEEHLYDSQFLGKRIEATANFEIDGAHFSISEPLYVDVAPAIEIKSIRPSPYVWTPATVGQPWVFRVTIANNLGTSFLGRAEIATGNGMTWLEDEKIQLQSREIRNIQLGPTLIFPARERLADQVRSIGAEISITDANKIMTERRVPAVYVKARVVPGLRVGYVPSFDQTLEHSLGALGVNSKALTIDEIKSADLSSYNTIIIDNRGYEAHPELIAANSRLLEFVQAGGTLIVFYHKDNEWNPDEKKQRPQLAPYPIILNDKRVTDETAPITLLQPRHPMLNLPNKITAADFVNWIQERGLYYPKEWDGHYAALFETNDPGEAPLKGGLLVAQYGKGNYIYTSMVWYRELRAGVPGAYRMFANMISYGHK